ncbi:helix-turn-helix transcriptional regulator [Microbacterium excoecariae]|uniref:helix-turn-helix transcriptional regulator n=1 Tax=Microbacterium excoecariae TaxID=2715210 RepID=UPI00140CCF09|nr:helix-turn-helix transcriptional regulator [Microbacterium excoecariae]NHI17723.1 helix-turn-helix domain-containing protein [Microbacterium excoecariae]
MARNDALSDFLTARRAAITPAMAGIPAQGVRRVPGLRREEVAFLAGVSVDWYVRLEQGRQVRPSESVLDAIARILQLDDAERDYLVNLARPSAGIRGSATPVVRPGIERMIRGLDDQPAFVLGPRMEVLAGNALAWALLHDFSAHPVGDRNLLRWIMTDPSTRTLYVDWSVVATEMTGVLQLEASAHPHDAEIAALVGELSTSTPEFRKWWAEPNPQGRTSGTKRFRHPIAGELTIEWEAFVVPDDETQTLFIYTARDAASREALGLLGAWGVSGSPGADGAGRVEAEARGGA